MHKVHHRARSTRKKAYVERTEADDLKHFEDDMARRTKVLQDLNPARKVDISERDFVGDRRTTAFSFAFTPEERTTFIKRWWELRQETYARVTDPDYDADKSAEHDFDAAWWAARRFYPSEEAKLRIKDVVGGCILGLDDHIAEFAQKCTLDPQRLATQPFICCFIHMHAQSAKDVKGLVLFLPFVVLFTLVLLSGKGLNGGFFLHSAVTGHQVSRLFKMPCTGTTCDSEAILERKFADVGEDIEFYQWLRKAVVDTIWFNESYSASATRPIANHMYPVGALRIRQVRVDPTHVDWQYKQFLQSNESKLTPTEQSVVDNCFPSKKAGDFALQYAPATTTAKWSKQVFGSIASTYPQHVRQAFNYTPCQYTSTVVKSFTIRGEMGYYPCGSFELIIPFNDTKTQALAAVNALADNSWVDTQTRGVFVDHVMFNKDLDPALFVHSLLGFEVASGGLWKPLRRSQMTNYFSWSSITAGWVFLIILYLVYLAAFIINFFYTVARHAAQRAQAIGHGFAGINFSFISAYIQGIFWALTNDYWVLIDALNYIMFIVAWIIRAMVWSTVTTDRVFEVHTYPYSLDAYAQSMQLLNYLDCVNVVVLYIKLFKYLKVFRVLGAITKTITDSAFDLYGIAFAFVILLAAFTICGHVVYGGVLFEFSTVELTLSTLLRFIIGDFDYPGWYAARKVVTPIYFTLIEVFLVVVLFNCIIAVLADNFSDVVRTSHFDDSKIVATMEADPTCSLTIGSTNIFRRNPISRELAYWFFLAKDRFKGPKRGTDRLSRLRKCMDSQYPATFWDEMTQLFHDIYYQPREKSAEAIEDLHGFFDIVKEYASKTSEIDPLRATLAILNTEQGEVNPHSVQGMDVRRDTVRDIYRTVFKSSEAFYIATCVHLPHEALRLSRTELLVRALEYHHIWTNEVQSLGPKVELDTDAIIEAASKDLRFIASGLKGSRKRSIYDEEQEEERKDEHVFKMRDIAVYCGMNKSTVDTLFPHQKEEGRKENEEEEDVAAVLEQYKTEWTKAHRSWRTDNNSDIGELDDEHFDGLADMIFDGFEPSVERRQIVINEARRKVFSAGWSMRKKNRFQMLLRQDTKLARVQSGSKTCLADTITISDFAQKWEETTETEMSEEQKKELREFINMTSDTPENEEFHITDFLEYCCGGKGSHASQSYQFNFFAMEHTKIFNMIHLALYVPFLVIFTALVVSSGFSGLGHSAYTSLSVADNLADDPFPVPQHVSYNDIRTEAHFYSWLQTNVIAKSFREDQIPGPNPPDLMNNGVGGVKIRQLRAEVENSCGFLGYATQAGNSSFYQQRVQDVFNGQCVPAWASATKSKVQFANVSIVSDAVYRGFTYTACQSLDFLVYGNVAMYSCGGHEITLPFSANQTVANQYVAEMQASKWIDHRTRALITEVFFYSYNNNVFTQLQFLLEVTAGGNWVPHLRMNTFRLHHFSALGGTYVAFFFIFMLLLFFNAGVLFMHVRNHVISLQITMSCTTLRALQHHTLEDPWWLMELVIFLTLFVSWILKIVMMGLSQTSVRLYDVTAYPERLQTFSELHIGVAALDAFAALLMYAKIFFFVRLHSGLNLLSKTLAKASTSIISVLVLSFVMITGFAIAGHVVYGHSVLSMSSVGKSYQVLFLSIFGEDDFDSWFRDKPVFTGIYFTTFTVLMVLIMFNMITSVLSEAYSSAKDEQYDAREAIGTIEIDPSVMKDSFLRRLMRNPAFTELFYWMWFPFVVWNKISLLDRKIKNHRTLFMLMGKVQNRVDKGSPSTAAVSAWDLFLIVQRAAASAGGSRNTHLFFSTGPTHMHGLSTGMAEAAAQGKGGGHEETDPFAEEPTGDEVMEKKRKKTDFNAELSWHVVEMLQNKTESDEQSIFGFQRQTMASYGREALPTKLYPVIKFWCIDVPALALGVGHAALLVSVLEVNHQWMAEAENYCKIGEDEDDNEQSRKKLFERKIAVHTRTIRNTVNDLIVEVEGEGEETK